MASVRALDRAQKSLNIRLTSTRNARSIETVVRQITTRASGTEVLRWRKIMNRKDFDSFAAADAFADQCEVDGHEHVSIISNTPAPGTWRVNYGKKETESPLHCMNRAIEDRENQAREAFNKKCKLAGRELAGRDAAAAAGFSGRDAEMFVLGFTGCPAKWADPRSEGRESIFRAGRKAWGTKEGQRASRAAEVTARRTIEFEPSVPISESGLIANGEH